MPSGFLLKWEKEAITYLGILTTQYDKNFLSETENYTTRSSEVGGNHRLMVWTGLYPKDDGLTPFIIQDADCPDPLTALLFYSL